MNLPSLDLPPSPPPKKLQNWWYVGNFFYISDIFAKFRLVKIKFGNKITGRRRRRVLRYLRWGSACCMSLCLQQGYITRCVHLLPLDRVYSITEPLTSICAVNLVSAHPATQQSANVSAYDKLFWRFMLSVWDKFHCTVVCHVQWVGLV